MAKGYEYARLGNPTRDSLQENLAAMENAKFSEFQNFFTNHKTWKFSGKVFSSGMAVTNAIVNWLRFGDHFVANNDGYGGTQRYFRLLNERKQFDITFVSFLINGF